MSVDITIRVAGQAGQGMQSIGYILGKIFTRHGYHVFLNQDVESRIRGGHSFIQARIASGPVRAISDTVDLLVALDKGVIEQDLPSLAENGVMIFDAETTGHQSDHPNHFAIPLQRLATEAGKSQIMVNTVATGATLALMEFDLQPLLDRLAEEFGRKGEEIVANNKHSATAGYRYVKENFAGRHPHKVPPTPSSKARMFVNGSEAMALGSLCSGLKFYAGYPMSPATPIMEFIGSAAEQHSIVFEPAEDEIAAVNMAVGASFAGVRAMTATSGGGFCLMVETLGLSGMTETPLVVVVVQRAGPATGLPTRTEQADLNFVIHAAHGEFPRAVFAPGYPEQAFSLMAKAFNMADRYQTPVIVLGDQHLNDSYFTADRLDMGQIRVDRGKIVSDDDIPTVKEYARYAWDDSGVSPRILPGQSAAVVYADSDEHTAAGHISESAEVRKQMMDKRTQKFQGMRAEMGLPEIYPASAGDIVLLGWGSTYGAMKEAVDDMNRAGFKVQMLHFSEIYPFPKANLAAKIDHNARIFAVENNSTGQFADLFSFETGLPIHRKLLKYDGRPFSPKRIIAEVKAQL